MFKLLTIIMQWRSRRDTIIFCLIEASGLAKNGLNGSCVISVAFQAAAVDGFELLFWHMETSHLLWDQPQLNSRMKANIAKERDIAFSGKFHLATHI